MAPEVTLECSNCHHRALKPAYISESGFAIVSWPGTECRCGGKMSIVDAQKDGEKVKTEGSAIRYGDKSDYEHACECERDSGEIDRHCCFKVSNPMARSRDISFRELLLVILDEGIIEFPHGSRFKVTKI